VAMHRRLVGFGEDILSGGISGWRFGYL
jgi:hypothetical protein